MSAVEIQNDKPREATKAKHGKSCIGAALCKEVARKVKKCHKSTAEDGDEITSRVVHADMVARYHDLLCISREL